MTPEHPNIQSETELPGQRRRPKLALPREEKGGIKSSFVGVVHFWWTERDPGPDLFFSLHLRCLWKSWVEENSNKNIRQKHWKAWVDPVSIHLFPFPQPRRPHRQRVGTTRRIEPLVVWAWGCFGFGNSGLSEGFCELGVIGFFLALLWIGAFWR